MIVRLSFVNRPVVVIGSSGEAPPRIERLLAEGAVVTTLGSPDALRPLAWRRWKLRHRHRITSSAFVLATDRDARLNAWLARRASTAGFLLCTLDETATCNVFHVAVREPLPGVEIAVSSSGGSPAFASRLATKLERAVTEEDRFVYEGFLDLRRSTRAQGASTFSVDRSEAEASLRERYRATSLNVPADTASRP
jgi:siroheme synthase (precorrin-2 oxidase/ferrochelatase)